MNAFDEETYGRLVQQPRGALVVDPVDGALHRSLRQLQLASLGISRDPGSADHIVFSQPVTVEEAIEYLWQGRLRPAAASFRPDPVEAATEARWTRFYFGVSPDEFVAARADFRRRYLTQSPETTLERRLPAWLPRPVRTQLVGMEEQGRFVASALPQLHTFPGEREWGPIAVWVGLDEFRRRSIEAFNYFPPELSFYERIAGAGSRRASLLHIAYTSWNADMRLFVEEKRWRPSDARHEVLRINTAIFKVMLEAIAGTFLSGGVEGTINGMRQSADRVAEAVATSSRFAGKTLLLAYRRNLPKIMIYRGTTLRWLRGASNEVHDLGFGTYFTTDPKVAQMYAQMRGAVDDPGFVLRFEVAKQELGRVLDLTQGPLRKRWDELVAQLGPGALVNERYRNLFNGFLKEIGHTVDDFDTFIGPEYLRGGIQINIRAQRILDAILSRAKQLPL